MIVSKKARVGVLAVCAVLVAMLLLAFQVTRSRASSLDVLGNAPAWKLTDQANRPVSSDQFRGKVVVADFIYTHCPDVCPLLSAEMQRLQQRLASEHLLGSRVQLLSFSIDPARDTPAVLHEYAQRYHADPDAWRFLTGPVSVVQPLVMNGFQFGLQKAPPSATTTAGAHAADAYDMVHTSHVVLIDPQGRIRAYYDGNELDIDQVVVDARAVAR